MIIPLVVDMINFKNTPTYVSKFALFTCFDSNLREFVFTSTEFATDPVGPLATSDIIEKLYMDHKFMSKADYDIAHVLPGIPFVDGLSMVAIPT